MAVGDEYRVHDVQWTPDKIGRFWDHYATAADDRYFAQAVGASLLQLVRRVVGQLTDPVLDFGCGSGHLLDMLLHAGHRCAGLDFSRDSVARVRQRLGDHSRLDGVESLSGCPTRFASNSFGTVFLLETLEHLLSDQRQSILQELFRLTAPGGHLVVTVPHAEDLERKKAVCPDCGCRFHPIQHVSSWTGQTLEETLTRVGYQTRYCQPTLLAKRGWRGKASRFVRLYLLRQKRPHLVFIGQKP